MAIVMLVLMLMLMMTGPRSLGYRFPLFRWVDRLCRTHDGQLVVGRHNTGTALRGPNQSGVRRVSNVPGQQPAHLANSDVNMLTPLTPTEPSER